ncbi:YveK family protein [Mycobacterium sp.]|uniref:YveK family protein n=1 Tax=Mycobacterium sp. TaxID=1785 RepID=UPI002DB503C9|nr:Wzz/FepE/Etk N-terminal domain-containing protein [Mycobacterium sp.]
MKSPSGAPRLRDYARIVRNGWIVILCATALSAGIGWLGWQTAKPVYQASTTLFVITPGSATPLDAYYGQLTAVSRVQTYQQLAQSSQVTSRTIDQLGLAETTEELAAQISVAPTTSALLDVVVTGTDAERTREIANAVGANMVELSRQLAAVDTADTELVMVDEAGLATRQGSAWRSVIMATALGFALSVVAVCARGLVADRLLARGEVGRVVGEVVAERER